MSEHGIAPDEIAQVDCRVLPFARDILVYEIARTPAEGKFSMNYCIAKMVLNRNLSMQDFRGETVDDSVLIDMMMRVHMIVDERLMPGAYHHISELEAVDITFRNGAVVSELCMIPKGSAENPMTPEERRIKNRDCITFAFGSGSEEELVPLIESVDELEKLRQLTAAVEKASNLNGSP